MTNMCFNKKQKQKWEAYKNQWNNQKNKDKIMQLLVGRGKFDNIEDLDGPIHPSF